MKKAIEKQGNEDRALKKSDDEAEKQWKRHTIFDWRLSERVMIYNEKTRLQRRKAEVKECLKVTLKRKFTKGILSSAKTFTRIERQSPIQNLKYRILQ